MVLVVVSEEDSPWWLWWSRRRVEPMDASAATSDEDLSEDADESSCFCRAMWAFHESSASSGCFSDAIVLYCRIVLMCINLRHERFVCVSERNNDALVRLMGGLRCVFILETNLLISGSNRCFGCNSTPPFAHL